MQPVDVNCLWHRSASEMSTCLPCHMYLDYNTGSYIQYYVCSTLCKGCHTYIAAHISACCCTSAPVAVEPILLPIINVVGQPCKDDLSHLLRLCVLFCTVHVFSLNLSWNEQIEGNVHATTVCWVNPVDEVLCLLSYILLIALLYSPDSCHLKRGFRLMRFLIAYYSFFLLLNVCQTAYTYKKLLQCFTLHPQTISWLRKLMDSQIWTFK